MTHRVASASFVKSCHSEAMTRVSEELESEERGVNLMSKCCVEKCRDPKVASQRRATPTGVVPKLYERAPSGYPIPGSFG